MTPEEREARHLLRQGQRLLSEAEYTWAKIQVRPLLWAAQDGVCLCCDRKLVSHYRFPLSGDRDTIDHVWSKGTGGPDKLGNLALMTHNCNNRKGSRLPTQQEMEALQAINERLGWPTPWFVW